MVRNSTQTIRVTSTRAVIDKFDALETLSSLGVHFGCSYAALMESGEIEHADGNSTVLAFAPVLSVAVADNVVTLTGNDGVVRFVVSRCLNSGFECDSEQVKLSKFGDVWELLRTIRDAFTVDEPETPNEFRFGFVGAFNYDVAHAIEELPSIIPSDGLTPQMILTIYSGHATINHRTGYASLTLHSSPGFWSAPDCETVLKCMTATHNSDVPEAPAPVSIETTIERGHYEKNVEVALEHIRAGDIYQCQLGHDVRIKSEIIPSDVYRRLRHSNPSPFMYLSYMGDTVLVGCSPELFIKNEDGAISVRPIAGTTGRGQNSEDDERLISEMRSSQKEIAEHIMLVDLARNDVSRAATPSTMKVDDLMIIEQYSHVSHLVSSVSGKVRADFDEYDVFAAMFPAGTMTGAPKIRAMEIIESLETTRRGLYAGAFGMIDFGGYINTALTIRSAVRVNGVYSIRASAGVVADSVPEREWRETWRKMAAPFWAITGMEVADAGLGN